jgi:putative alpha-1,2-mannosidase
LIQLMGKEEFNRRLGEMFENAHKSKFGGGSDEIHSFSGIEKQYNHGNQPCLHDSWLFNYSGQPWLTQKWTRAICDEFYGTEPLRGYGVGQDEDQGQLGAWYVMAALGLFDVQGHTSMNPTFQFGSPQFDKVTIQLDPDYYSGKELVIETKNNSNDNVYIQSLTFNGKLVEKNWIDRKELMSGGMLIFEMGNQPNTNWGVNQPPPSMSDN